MSAMEMESFLPQNGSGTKDGALVPKIVPAASKDAEGSPKRQGDDAFDPFLERVTEKPTTDCETLTHLLKSSLGTGILSMPLAFKNSGLTAGIIGTLFVGLICTHCAYILVECAHVLYVRTRKTKLGFAGVAETALATGPKWGQKYAKAFGLFIQICLFVTYFGAVSVYTVIISKNFLNVLKIYYPQFEDESYIRPLILCLLLPLILLCWVRNLKYLAPFSTLANILMGISLGITFYYLVSTIVVAEKAPPTEQINLTGLPNFFSITVFAIEAIGVIMPLENDMKTPKNFVGTFGVLNRGMFGVTLLYIVMGVLGYCGFGICTEDLITSNLPMNEKLAQAVNVFIALAVFFTFGLQFYVCIDIMWNAIKDRFESRPILANYVLRTVMVFLSVMLAFALPKIGPFVGLIGAFCFSILGLLIPVLIETVTYWDIGFGRGNWRAVKNVLIGIVAVIVLVAGSISAMDDIVKFLSGAEKVKLAECTPTKDNNNTTTMTAIISTTVETILNSTTTMISNATTTMISNSTTTPSPKL